jgi:hypothetical protein
MKLIIKKTKIKKKQYKNIRISMLKFNNLKKKIIKLVKIYIWNKNLVKLNKNL